MARFLAGRTGGLTAPRAWTSRFPAAVSTAPDSSSIETSKKFRINRLQSTRTLWYHLGGSLESSPLKCRKSNQRSRIIN
jgi:hypothetical protein